MRGSAGVTVRQLESLIRLSEAVARVHLDEVVRVEHVDQAFDLQWNSLRRTDRENIDLNPDVAENEVAAPERAGDGDGGATVAGAPARPRRLRISYGEYQRIGQLLAQHLAKQEAAGEVVQEQDLIAWYMELVEDTIRTETELFETQHKVQMIIARLIDKDRVIIVYQPSTDPMKPEQRVLIKHPNFPVGETIGAAAGGRRA